MTDLLHRVGFRPFSLLVQGRGQSQKVNIIFRAGVIGLKPNIDKEFDNIISTTVTTQGSTSTSPVTCFIPNDIVYMSYTTTFTATITSTIVDANATTTFATTITPAAHTSTHTSPPTFYAQCTSQNLLGTSLSDGTFLMGINFRVDPYDLTSVLSQGPDVSWTTTNGTNGYDCCVQCANMDGCVVGSYQDWEQQCSLLYLEATTTCGGQSVVLSVSGEPKTPGGVISVVFNGQCGRLESGDDFYATWG